LTKTELRILYLLNKNAGQLRHSKLQQAMSRVPPPDRETALRMLEEMQLVSSGKSPSKTRPALLYWLTQAGKDQVQELITAGELGEAP
jgi:DNA-binding HxlR family transcriptional regulator